MKRGWLAAGLLAGMMLLAWWHVQTLEGLTGDLRGRLTEAQALARAGSWEEAERRTGEAAEMWEEKGFYLHVTLRHDTVDGIASAFAETRGFLDTRELSEYTAANARLLELLRLLGDAERPRIENLL